MADVNIVIGAQDMASSVMKNIAAQTRVFGVTVSSMSKSVVSSTQAMSAGFTSLYMSMLPLLGVILTMQAAFAVFRFGAASVQEFIAAGTPAGVELKEALDIAGVALKNLMVVIGGVLAPAVKAGAEVFIVLTQAISQSLTPAVGGMQSTFEAIAPYIEAFKVGIIAAITGIEVGIKNFDQVFAYVTQSLQLRMVEIALAVGTFFLKTAPQAIFDFAIMVAQFIPKVPKIIYDTFVTIFGSIQSVVLGLQKKIFEVFQAIWDFIKSGGQNAVSNSAMDFAQLAAQQIQAAQTEAARQVESLAFGQGLATNMLDGLESQRDNLRAGIAGTASDLAGEFNATFQQRLSALQAPALPAPEVKKEEENQKKATEGLAKVAEAQASIAQQLSATESRLLTRGPSEGPMQSVAQASQKTAEAVEKTSQSSDRMVELLEQLLARNFIVAEAV